MNHTAVEADLGRLYQPPHTQAGMRHRLLFVADIEAVAMPYSHAGGAWHCMVVATRQTGATRPGHLVLTEQELVAATGRLVLDVTDEDGLAQLLWPARVFLRWPGGAFPPLAQLLVEELRVPGTLHIPAETVADLGRLSGRLPNTRPPAVARMLETLRRVGFLTADPAGGQTLTIPAQPPAQAEASVVNQ
jgi:hypothetical protein